MQDQQAADDKGRAPIFTARDVSKVYHSGEVEVVALAGIDLDLYPGEMVVLLGPSGSGKSTLLNIIGGLDRASTGTVRFRDEQISDYPEWKLTRYRRAHVGFVFQFYNLIPSLTARENVALVAEISKNPMPPEEALEMVGLKHRLDHFPAQMSGGEQQRVAIARAIAKRPDVLFCDEPTGALDSKTGILVLDVLYRINAELGATIAIITHNADIRKIAHRVISFRDGTIEGVERNETRLKPTDIQW
ncbi:ABC transporter ATP-binding protein [Martelella endophytica]|uniref:ABC transporter ATP-binding protein n=1 Tax=Martelella endophytica TaxID=1486262 RepID=UPI0005F110BD|nr:ABC transporter ATP-binding protein [Martelella endophytica]